MKGDFTRDTFDSARHFSRVLMQQGRVQLDADFNEQASILLHYLRTMMLDLIGPFGGPGGNLGFQVTKNDKKKALVIGEGRYYVDGILCENLDDGLECRNQKGLSEEEQSLFEKAYAAQKRALVYLDVWERHITCVQDDSVREKALGGPDTCSRARVVWNVRVQEASDESSIEKEIQGLEDVTSRLEKLLKNREAAQGNDIKCVHYEGLKGILLQRAALLENSRFQDCNMAREWAQAKPKCGNARMRARVKPEKKSVDPCSLPTESRYRGFENQLYRIEVHRAGDARDRKSGEECDQAATFKWSRDNGSIVFPIVSMTGESVKVASLGKDERTSLRIGNWVEIIDDDLELQCKPGIMAQVDSVDLVKMEVTLKRPDDAPAGPLWRNYDETSANHPLLRRWDHREVEGLTMSQGAICVSESDDRCSGWIEIEDGVEIQFVPTEPIAKDNYRTGDYWLIPARVATGTIEWPAVRNGQGQIETDKDGNALPMAMPPHGIEHHYAPLAIMEPGAKQPTDCRCEFEVPSTRADGKQCSGK